MLSYSEALRVVAKAQFREFTQADWYAFAGCETPNPLAAEVTIDGVDYIIIIDGDQLTFNPASFDIEATGTFGYEGTAYSFEI